MGNSYSLFLRQSYLDAWEDYRRSLHRADFPVWDYIILTASNEAQANAYRQQIAIRRAKNLLPARTHYAVLPDPDGLRVGSGGATLNALRYVCTQEGTFAGKRILCIHSGGDSKRVPQYSACGKLFSPVPRELPNGRRSTLFDEFIIGMSGVPSRIRDGMLVLSGDVLLLFNPLQIDAPASGAAAISFKEDVETGKNHGVFQMDEQGNVGEFLHKQTVETLTSRGAVNAQGKVDIDTGAVLFSADLLADLYTLVDTPAKFAAFVNDRARLSFYGDFLYPLASRSTLEQFYREKPDGSFTEELHACRTAVWQVLRKYRMRLLRLAPASFIHFGTTHELRTLMTDGVSAYSFLDWKKCVSACCSSANYALNNAMVEEGCCIHDDCYLEDSHVMGSAIIGSGTVLSHVTISGKNIPANVVLHSLKLADGRFVTRIYGVADNPKEGTFLGGSMAAFGNVWDGDDHSLWQAKIYPVCDSMAESVDAALNVYALAMGAGDYDAWASVERVSLCSSFNSADTAAILEWETHLRKAVKVECFLSVIRRGGTIEEAKKIFQDAAISAYQRRLIAEKAASADVFTRMRIFYCLGKVLGDSQEGEAYIKRAFEEIQRMVLGGRGSARHGALRTSSASGRRSSGASAAAGQLGRRLERYAAVLQRKGRNGAQCRDSAGRRVSRGGACAPSAEADGRAGKRGYGLARGIHGNFGLAGVPQSLRPVCAAQGSADCLRRDSARGRRIDGYYGENRRTVRLYADARRAEGQRSGHEQHSCRRVRQSAFPVFRRGAHGGRFV